MKALRLLAFARIPGNAFSFWVRRSLRWSRGTPALCQEPKDDLYSCFQQGRSEAEARAAELHDRYRLADLARLSTRALYRKNLDLLDTLEKTTQGLPLPFPEGRAIKALDVGSQDWHYVFALERWLQRHNRKSGEPVEVTGIELDGYEIYADFHSRKDYAQAYAEQTGNPQVRYRIGDFLKWREGGQDVIFLFYPLVLRYQLLLWGLPLRHFAPISMLKQAAALIRPDGWLVVYCHTLREHEALLELATAAEAFQLLREGRLSSELVVPDIQTNDRRFSIWKSTKP